MGIFQHPVRDQVPPQDRSRQDIEDRTAASLKVRHRADASSCGDVDSSYAEYFFVFKSGQIRNDDVHKHLHMLLYINTHME